MKKLFIFTILILSLLLTHPSLTPTTSADIGNTIRTNLSITGERARFSEGQIKADPRDIVINIINTALTLFGIAFTVLILYGGWLWMTAAGNQENIDKAKKVLQWATIGIAITIMSLSASLFISNILLRASGSTVEIQGS